MRPTKASDAVGRQRLGGGARRGQGVGDAAADEVMQLRLDPRGFRASEGSVIVLAPMSLHRRASIALVA